MPLQQSGSGCTITNRDLVMTSSRLISDATGAHAASPNLLHACIPHICRASVLKALSVAYPSTVVMTNLDPLMAVSTA